MSQINISNLTFSYNGSYDTIFKHVSFCIDTNWKLGFIGRNGKGKTTFFHLLMGKYDYSGHISSNVTFEHFPYDVKDKSQWTIEVISQIYPDYKYTHPILGICLGHQAIAETFGASLYNLSRPLHGHRSVLKKVDEHDPLFEDLADPIQVGRYHSWVID